MSDYFDHKRFDFEKTCPQPHPRVVSASWAARRPLL